MQYLAMDIYPIPVGVRSKVPIGDGWQNQRLTVDDLDEKFSNGQNIGIMPGIPPAYLFDLDADCREVLQLIQLLPPPPTDRVFGHSPSKPFSHFEYLVGESFTGAKFCDTRNELNPKTGKMHYPTMIEYRGAAQQVVAPPSIHESGEPITWHKCGAFGRSIVEILSRYIRKIAAASLIVRHWPEGDRHTARWALEAVLFRAGWDDVQVTDYVAAIVEVAQPGESEAVDKIPTDITRYRELVEKGENVIGFPTLAEKIGMKEARTVCKWLGIRNAEHRDLSAEFDIHLTDIGNGIRLVRRHGDDLRYSNRLGWLAWNGKFWAVDETGEVERKAKDTPCRFTRKWRPSLTRPSAKPYSNTRSRRNPDTAYAR